MKRFNTMREAVMYYRMQGLGRQEIQKMIDNGLVEIRAKEVA